MIYTAVRGGNPQTKADAFAPTVPKFLSVPFQQPSYSLHPQAKLPAKDPAIAAWLAAGKSEVL
ncbi:hypothetical protein [Paenibacillus sp. FSL M7-1046]|uniref:hypothetical protein n=1 Tax=Paenibacillus sp. FSL M7-1046 TaxID=2975315 RepID=UPI0030FBD6AE